MTQPTANIELWDRSTPLNNGTIDAAIAMQENVARNLLNDGVRAIMQAAAKYKYVNSGVIVTGGSANAQTFTSGYGYGASDTIPAGFRARLKVGPALTNSAALTLAMDSVAAMPVKNIHGAALGVGEWLAANIVEVISDGTNWILIQSSFNNGAAATFTPANPTGVATATTLMMGLGSTCTITPLFSTRAHVSFVGRAQNNNAGNGSIQLRVNSGSAPANGAALTGNQVGATLTCSAGLSAPFAIVAVLTGMVVGTTYWLDLAVTATGVGGFSIDSLTCAPFEV